MINYSIGSRIRELRIKNGLSQLQLSLLSDITPAYLSLLERDEKNPTVNCLSKICTGLNISMKDFFDIENDITSKITINKIIKELNSFNTSEQEEVFEIIKHISKIKDKN